MCYKMATIDNFGSLYAKMENFISAFSMQFISILLYILIFVGFKSVLHKFKRAQKVAPSLHQPPSYPIIGCLISFYQNRRRLLDWYTELLAESPTSTIIIDRLGAQRTIVTANPENVEYILKTNFDNFPKGKPFTRILGDFLGNGIFNVDGERWQAQRKLASHEFTVKFLKEVFMPTLHEEVERGLLPVLGSLAEKGQVVDFQELLRRLAFNLVCKVSLGIEGFPLDPSLPMPPLATAFDSASEICARRGAAPLSLVWMVKRWLGIGSERRLKENVEEIHRYVAEMINKRKKAMEREETCKEDLLSRLILAGHEGKAIRDMVVSYILAGRDTTSAAMTWLLWLLSQHGDIEQEILKEAKGMKQGELHYNSLKELRFLTACLYESMRLYPPVAWDSKHPSIDDILPDNTPVHAGDRVTYFPYGMGRMERIWGKNWSKFEPERWFVDRKQGRELKKVCPFKFPVFQGGPRVCLGKEMAVLQMKYVLASILENFKVRPVSSDTPVFVPFLTAYMAGGFNVLVQRRDSN